MRIRRRVHLIRGWEGAILVGMRRLHRGHGGALRDGLGDGRDLLLNVDVSRFSRQRGIDGGAHGGWL